jgi:hypothetical protein
MRRRTAPLVAAALALPSLMHAHGPESAQRVNVEATEQAPDARLPEDHATDLAALSVQNVRLESAPPIEDSPSVTLKFDVHNEGTATFADLVLTASLVDRSGEDPTAEEPDTIAGPFVIRVKTVLMPGFTFSYKARLRNISVECHCSPRIAPRTARILSKP